MENLILIAAIIMLVTVERIPSVHFTPSRFFRPFFTTDVVYFLTGALGLGFVLQAYWNEAVRFGFDRSRFRDGRKPRHATLAWQSSGAS